MDDFYLDALIELYKKPKHYGKIEGTHSYGSNPSCGDEVTVYLKIEKNKVVDASFEGKGCVISTASASLLMDYIIGKDVEEVKNIDKDVLFKLLRIDLSHNPSRIKCALLPLMVLKRALE